MASTIKLKNGSGAPLASDLVAGEPALDLTNKRLYTEDSGGTVIEVGTNPTSLTTGDITATGTTTITTADINGGAIDGTTIGGTTTAAGSFTTLQADTSLNVDGTVTADGLTVDGSSTFDDIKLTAVALPAAGNPSIALRNTDNNIYIQSGSGNGITFLDSSQNTMLNATPTSHALQISNGNAFSINSGRDISFYEDTGTTPKLFWDASAESLGIGTSSPAQLAHLFEATADTGAFLQVQETGGQNAYFGVNTSGGSIQVSGANPLQIATNGSERMRIDSSGNLDLTNGGGNIIMANGAGIDFSASAGGGASSSLLDDYEEGTWTPALTRASTSPSVTYNTQSATYTKIGNRVHVSLLIILSAVASSGSGVVSISGLPFSAGGATYSQVLTVGYNDIFDAAVNFAFGSGSSITIGNPGITQANFSGVISTGYLTINGSYLTTA